MLACAQHNTKQENLALACLFPNKQAAPAWVCGKPVPGLALQAVGVADKSVAGTNYMHDMARIAAEKHLTEAFKIHAGKSVIQYLTSINVQSEDAIKAGASAIKSISIKTLAGAKQYRFELGPEGRAYVLLGLDENTRSALLESVLKTSINNDQALWQKIKMQKSFDEVVTGIVTNGSVE